MKRTIKNLSAPSATGLGSAMMRTAMTLAVVVLTAMTAWANEPVKYIDENGDEQEVTEYTVLTGTEAPDSYGWIELAEGTYVVNSSNLTYQHTIRLTGNTTLILADGANMTVEPTQENFGIGIEDASITIYGQENQTGTLTVSGKGDDNYDMMLGSLTINGGAITVFGEVYVDAIFTLNGGFFTVEQDENGKASIEASNNFTVNGGTLTVNGSDYGIDVGENVAINGGVVNISGSQYGIRGRKSITITGGTVNATATATTGNNSDGLHFNNTFTMSGGVVTATGYKYGLYCRSIRFSGGQLTANVTTGGEWSDSAGINCSSSFTSIYIYYSHASDFIKVTSYSLSPYLCFGPDFDNLGCYTFVDEANPATEFSGFHKKSDDANAFNALLASMAGKKLVPKHCTVNLQNGITASGDDVTVDGSTVKATVALPVTLTTPGYENVSLTVKDANNADVTLTDGTFTIAQGSIGNRTYKANFDIATLQDGTAYTLTGDAEVKAASYIKTIGEQRVGRHQAWMVPFDYTLTEADLDAFTFYKINMIANSPSPSQEATDEVWVFLTRLNAGAVLHANMPYVYKPKAEVTDYAFTTPNATLKAKNTGVILKTETAEESYSFYATYDQYTTTTTAEPFYYVGIDGNLSLGTAVSVGPLRWIIRKESKFGGETSYAREMHFFDGETTGIVELKNSRIEELKSNTEWYDLSGRKLSGKPTVKGVYVVNGRKVIVK